MKDDDDQPMFKQWATGHWRIWTSRTTSIRFRWWKPSHLRVAVRHVRWMRRYW